MGKFLKIIGLSCGGCLVIIIALGMFGYSQLDDTIHVERSRVIDAPIEVLFPLVDTVRRWDDWDPWHKLDTGMSVTFEGPPAGTGAIRRWSSSNPRLGAGYVEVVDSLVGEEIHFDVHMEDGPTIHASMTFEETPDGVLVTWTDKADLDGFVEHLFGLIANDYFLGPMLEEGLKRLDRVAVEKARALLPKVKAAINADDSGQSE